MPYVIDKFGAPGEIRTPDLMVRSHALVFAFTPVIIELFYNGPPIEMRVRASYGPLNVVTIGLNGGIKVGQQLVCSDSTVAL